MKAQKSRSKLPSSRVTLNIMYFKWEIRIFLKVRQYLWTGSLFFKSNLTELTWTHLRWGNTKKKYRKVKNIVIPSNHSWANMSFSPFLSGSGRLVTIWSTEIVFKSTLLGKTNTFFKVECLRRQETSKCSPFFPKSRETTFL